MPDDARRSPLTRGKHRRFASTADGPAAAAASVVTAMRKRPIWCRAIGDSKRSLTVRRPSAGLKGSQANHAVSAAWRSLPSTAQPVSALPSTARVIS